ncbi:MAG: DUF512 domain-containing protein [Eggerthellaceae bacterium]|nr:DUF512 domain-containing protein [Eggerthellaceae bacterium]
MPPSSAYIAEVCPGSPADDAGLRAGCRVTSVDGYPLRDIIDWRWHAAADSVEVVYEGADGISGVAALERDPGESWGLGFEDIVFDGVMTCTNACVFCFMRQLPPGMRPSLYLRDDDFRLSFLQGTYITCTNITAADEARIVEQHISPLRVSLHAVTPAVRAELIGPYAAYGLAVCERLLAAGIELHMQIVLVPGVNDGEELKKSLEWAWGHPGVLDVAVVPLGFTKHQDRFSSSYDDAPAARQVLADIAPFQERSAIERGGPWVFAADELYCNAYPHDVLGHLPPADYYGDYELFEDGIGMIRATVEAWGAAQAAAALLAKRLSAASCTIGWIAGCAQRGFLEPLLADSPLYGLLVPLFVRNDFFGGNVNVTGLLCGADILAAIEVLLQGGGGPDIVAIPSVVFNECGLTLDDMSLEDMQSACKVRLAVVSCNPTDYLEEMAALVS